MAQVAPDVTAGSQGEATDYGDDVAQGVNAFQNGQYEQAYKLLLAPAERGELRAQLILARLFYAGHGVAQSHDQYRYWLQRSADSGDKASKSLLKRMARGEVEPPFELQREHLRFFELYGFLHIRQFYVPEVPNISARYDRLPGAGNLLHEEFFHGLATNERTATLAARILGHGFTLAACQARTYTAPQRYRFGGSLRTEESVTAVLPGLGITLFLDRSDAGTGAVRLVAGSHRVGERMANELHRALATQGGLGKLPGGEGATLSINARPGDLLLLDRQLVHAPAVSRKPMRTVIIEYLGHENLLQKVKRKFLHRY